MKKVMASLAILVGGLSSIIALIEAAGVDISEPMELAIGKVAGVGLAALGVWLHPSIPVGSSEPEEK